MAVFYWTIYRPDLMPISFLFIVGLIEDCVTGGALGVTSLILVGTHGILLGQRRVFLGKPFALTWWGFALVACGAAILRYLIASWQAGTLVAITQAVMQCVSTLVLFPLVVGLCVGLHRRLLPSAGAYL
jgi:rod shape-determining protein MreD